MRLRTRHHPVVSWTAQHQSPVVAIPAGRCRSRPRIDQARAWVRLPGRERPSSALGGHAYRDLPRSNQPDLVPGGGPRAAFTANPALPERSPGSACRPRRAGRARCAGPPVGAYRPDSLALGGSPWESVRKSDRQHHGGSPSGERRAGGIGLRRALGRDSTARCRPIFPPDPIGHCCRRWPSSGVCLLRGRPATRRIRGQHRAGGCGPGPDRAARAASVWLIHRNVAWWPWCYPASAPLPRLPPDPALRLDRVTSVHESRVKERGCMVAIIDRDQWTPVRRARGAGRPRVGTAGAVV